MSDDADNMLTNFKNGTWALIDDVPPAKQSSRGSTNLTSLLPVRSALLLSAGISSSLCWPKQIPEDPSKKDPLFPRKQGIFGVLFCLYDAQPEAVAFSKGGDGLFHGMGKGQRPQIDQLQRSGDIRQTEIFGYVQYGQLGMAADQLRKDGIDIRAAVPPVEAVRCLQIIDLLAFQ